MTSPLETVVTAEKMIPEEEAVQTREEEKGMNIISGAKSAPTEVRRIADLVQQYYARSALTKDIAKEVPLTSIPEKANLILPEEVIELLKIDESLYDLMRHKSTFQHVFGREFQQSLCGLSHQMSEAGSWGEQRMKNYMCFSSFFLAKECLYQKGVLEIHHSYTSEKTNFLNYLVAELLRSDCCSSSSPDQESIPPQILFFDNTQQLDYEQLQLLIKVKLLEVMIVKASGENEDMEEEDILEKMESQAALLSSQCLSKLYVIESRDLLEFSVNLMSLKHILTTQKAIRVVVFDTLNAFSVEAETNSNTAHENNNLSSATPLKTEITRVNSSEFHYGSSEKKKKRKVSQIVQKGSVARMQESVIREYLCEVQRKFQRVAFVQTRRDYYKVRNLITIDENSTALFKASPELVTILERDDLDIDGQTTTKENDFTNIYLMSLDNFSSAALEKAVQQLRPEEQQQQMKEEDEENAMCHQPSAFNTQRISVVVKKNHVNNDQLQVKEEEGEDAVAQREETVAQREALRQFDYQMNFYAFEAGDFMPASDLTYYFS